jgi:type III secretory pathway component EscV
LVLSWVVRQLLTAVIVIRAALILTGSADILHRHTKRGNYMTQNKSDRLTKLFPIAFVATAALWLVVILITDFPAWTLAVYVALGIPAVKYFSRSDKNDQPD